MRMPLFLRRMSATKNSRDFIYLWRREALAESFRSILLLMKAGRASGTSLKGPRFRILDISRFGALPGLRPAAVPLLLTDESGGTSRLADTVVYRGNSGCLGPSGLGVGLTFDASVPAFFTANRLTTRSLRLMALGVLRCSSSSKRAASSPVSSACCSKSASRPFMLA